jgi:Zn-dependent protease with chaperone function
MITALVLGGYAALVGIGAPRLLPRLWPGDRTPRRTVALLMILAYSLPLSAITGGFMLGVTLLDVLARIDPTVDACADRLPINDESPVAPLLGATGMIVAGLLAARICFCLVSTLVAARLRRRAHAAVLRLCGRPDGTSNVIVLEHDQAASYCLPGHGGRIVVTRKAIQLLTADQLGAVLAHERAHLRGRHHVLITLAAALRRAVPRVRLIAYTDREVRRLVELMADDAAARDHGPLAVATALAVLGAGHVPGGALGVVEGPGALARIARLAAPPAGMSRGRTVLSGAVVAAAVIVPVLLAAGSVAVLARHCPPSTDDEHPHSSISRLR